MRLSAATPGYAARAAATADFASAVVAVGNVPTTSSRFAGLRLAKSSRGGGPLPGDEQAGRGRVAVECHGVTSGARRAAAALYAV